jgi:hypothetical protein
MGIKQRIENAKIRLREIYERQKQGGSDIEHDGVEAETILLDVIDDEELTNMYELIEMWKA